MITSDNKRLEVLDRFIIDEKLPKHVKIAEELNSGNRGSSLIRTRDGNVLISDSNGEFGISNISVSGGSSTTKSNIITKFFNGIFNKTKNKPEQPKITVQEYFNGIKESAISIKNVQSRIDGYMNLLSRAQDSGQVALAEKLIRNIDIVKYETQLVDAGFDVCISEADVIRFFVNSDRGIALDYMKNFTRVIPCEIIEAKQKLDELHVFDNYVVMHYDPNKEASEMTEKEVEDKKDPILFGLIKDSDKLYFIGDWIDDICDLTFDELIEVLGEDGIDETKLNVNMYGDVEDVPCSEDNISS